MIQGNHSTNKKGSHQCHYLLPDRGTDLFCRAQTAFSTYITTTKRYFCSFPSSKPIDLLPSLLGKCGDPILTPQPRWRRITSTEPHTCSETQASLLPAINFICLFLFEQNFGWAEERLKEGQNPGKPDCALVSKGAETEDGRRGQLSFPKSFQ